MTEWNGTSSYIASKKLASTQAGTNGLRNVYPPSHTQLSLMMNHMDYLPRLKVFDRGTPFLRIFIICMEVLSLWLINAAANKNSGIGNKIFPRSNTVLGLLFADDCLLFCKTTMASSTHLKSLLDKFCDISGQLINYHKSTLTFSHNAIAHQENIVIGIFYIPHQASLGKYLGCPLFQGRPSKTTFKEIIDKATAKLQG